MPHCAHCNVIHGLLIEVTVVVCAHMAQANTYYSAGSIVFKERKEAVISDCLGFLEVISEFALGGGSGMLLLLMQKGR